MTKFQEELKEATELYRNWYHNYHMHLEADSEHADWMDKEVDKASQKLESLIARCVDNQEIERKCIYEGDYTCIHLHEERQ